MSILNALGLFAVTAMVVCYALEDRHRSFILTFVFSCVPALFTVSFKVHGRSDWSN